jgi:hypothetical protein
MADIEKIYTQNRDVNCLSAPLLLNLLQNLIRINKKKV